MKNNEKFTAKAEEAIEQARLAAFNLGHSYVGTEHLLLGILREGAGLGAKILRERGVSENSLKKAVEKCSGYTIPHGDAVAIGLARICTAAAKKGILPQDDYGRIIALLDKYALPTSCDFSADKLFAAALSDKKITGGVLQLVVPEGIGSCRIMPLQTEEFRSWID